MGVFTFLAKKKFYLHLLIIVLLSAGLFWAAFRALDMYTRHGEVYVVPDFRGLPQSRVMQQFSGQFNFILSDSIYQKGAPNGSIIQQDPMPGSKVKRGRNIYYVIVAQMPEKVAMPNLRNLSLRQAMVLLETAGLRLNELIYTEHFAFNAVIEQNYIGEVIEPGTEIFKGAEIDLLLGNGGHAQKTQMPMLIGERAANLVNQLHQANLNVGNQYYIDANDSINARVYRTEPPSIPGLMVDPGTKIDIWYRSDKLFNFDELLQQLKSDSISSDSVKSIINKLYENEDQDF